MSIFVSDILRQYSPGTYLSRREACEVLGLLRKNVPNFREYSGNVSFCHGKYTAPTSRWTASDETGSFEMRWSVNAANGRNNGYRITRDSWWESNDIREALSFVKGQESHVRWLNEKIAECLESEKFARQAAAEWRKKAVAADKVDQNSADFYDAQAESYALSAAGYQRDLDYRLALAARIRACVESGDRQARRNWQKLIGLDPETDQLLELGQAE